MRKGDNVERDIVDVEHDSVTGDPLQRCKRDVEQGEC